MSDELQTVDGGNWREFVSGDGVTYLMLGKSDCAACNVWTDELKTLLPGLERYAGKVRFGKMLLDQRGLTEFKREHGEWLKDVHDLPFNTLWVEGAPKKSWPGGGADRLTNRLDGLVG